ncbi:protein S40-4-like [Primulina huaijiensis]|uniref:protein S40-4-like n=1 Tax=Primulina huaijiensis TaxID=1492673 RepID=UPI003CC71553
MATSKTYFSRPNYKFLPTDQLLADDNSTNFELEESDVWSSLADRSSSPEIGKKSSRVYRKHAVSMQAAVASSMPVNVPDWSKILKDEYKENRLRYSDDDYEEGDRIPPHEFLAQKMARTGIASSVHEGVGRTLKGRDLSRVRNAILQKTGYQD